MNIKWILGLLALIGTSILVYYCIPRSTEKQSQNTFIVGTVSDYAPWVSTNPNGDYEGFDVDVAKAVATQMGKQLEIKDLGSMTTLFVALDQGSIDAIIWGLSITQERLDKMAMIRYQGDEVTSYPLIFWKQIPDLVKSINDMNGMTICVEPASAQEAVLRDYPTINIQPTERVDDALLNIQYGKANAALVEPAIANKFKQKYPEIVSLEVPLSAQNRVYGVGIAIKQQNTSLTDSVTKAVKALIQNGTIARYEKTWGIA